MLSPQNARTRNAFNATMTQGKQFLNRRGRAHIRTFLFNELQADPYKLETTRDNFYYK